MTHKTPTPVWRLGALAAGLTDLAGAFNAGLAVAAGLTAAEAVADSRNTTAPATGWPLLFCTCTCNCVANVTGGSKNTAASNRLWGNLRFNGDTCQCTAIGQRAEFFGFTTA